MSDIFISYSRPDRARIAKLAAALEKAGYSVWWDMNLTGGAQFSKETGEKLREAKAVVVAWSKTSIESMWVADEATVGRTKKNLVPIAIDKVEPPLGFGQIHAIDFADWDGASDDAAFLQLDKSLSALLDRAPAEIAPARPNFLRHAALGARRRPGAVVAAAFAVVAAILAAFLFANRTPTAPIEDSAIAVLPFVNAGGDPKEDYLSEGLADELRDQLARVGGLKVAARASSVAFREETLGAAEIARQLGVARLVEGSLSRQGGRVRISVKVIDGRTGFQTWSQRYDRPAADLLAIQQEIAAHIVAALPGKTEAPAPATTDISAYDKLLLARHYEQEVHDAPVVDEEKLEKVIDLYRAAVAADPASAIAHSRLAGALLYAGDADAAEPIIFRALNLDPNLSEVQYTLGAFYYSRVMPGVTAAFERAVELNPNNADALSGYAHQLWFGANLKVDVPKTEEFFRRARDVDPMSLRRHSELGYFYAVAGQTEKAHAVVRDIGERFAHPRGYSAIAQILEQTGDFDVAIAAAKKALSISPEDEDIKAQLAELYAVIGDFETAALYEPEPGLGQLFWRRDYPALIDLAQNLAIDRPGDAQIWQLLGFAYSVKGDYENAVRVLKLAGLPERARGESRTANDIAAMVTLAAALEGANATEEARAAAELAAREIKRYVDGGTDRTAWSPTLLSCALAVLGRDDEAMATFARVNDGPGLPRMPWLKDYPCFKRFAADSRYTSVIAAVEKRQAEIRARVAAAEEAQ